MLNSVTKRDWRFRIASLRQKAAAGEVSAVAHLGLIFFHGVQDQRGRTLVRRNSRAALALLRQAANGNDSTAAATLGYAYDIGLGAKPNAEEAVRWYRRAVRGGSSMAASNL